MCLHATISGNFGNAWFIVYIKPTEMVTRGLSCIKPTEMVTRGLSCILSRLRW